MGLRTLLDNPFLLTDTALRLACEQAREISRAELEAHSERLGADSVALALTHGLALSGGSADEILRDRTLGARWLAVTADRRRQHLRVALASARCVRALHELHGVSQALADVRRDAWAACFGRTLAHGLSLERVVRSHDVVVTGETGTGKELVARAIGAALSKPEDHGPAPFAEINAAAVPDALVESELFGHVKGAFTGAIETRVGLVRSADGGTLLLDEVGDLPLSTQAKLLRVIETDQVQPVGADRLYRVDVRFIAATHRDLQERVAQGTFRADLYQRLAGLVIRMPPLRVRPEDIVVIGEAFISSALAHDARIDPAPILRWLRSAEAKRYSWPGNVRELRNVLRNLLLGLPAGLAKPASVVADDPTPLAIQRGEASLADVETWYLERTVARVDGNLAAAARILAIDRTTIARKLQNKGQAT